MSVVEEVVVPDIGDFADIAVIEVLVKPGDVVSVGDALVTLESDKATMEVPSPAAGTVKEVLIAVGDTVSMGSSLLKLDRLEAQTSAPGPEPQRQAPIPSARSEPAPHAPAHVEPAPSPPRGDPAETDPLTTSVPPSADAARSGPPHASPSVRRFARELGVDVGQVSPSGPKGRILREDVQGYVKARLQRRDDGAGGPMALAWGIQPSPPPDFSKYGEIERVELSRIRKLSGPNLARNWVQIPHVTNFDEADVTSLEEFRRQVNQEAGGAGVKTTLLSFVVKACAAALVRFPEFNSSLDGDHLILKRYFHIGVAVDTPGGLVVPVVRNADRKGVLDIAAELAQLASRAREGKAQPADMQGGSFSVSSLGSIGGLGFTPIINAPQVAILGVAKSRMQPVWDGERFQPRLMLPLSMSWDHRAVDGAAAGRFLVHLASLLHDFRRLSL